MITASTMTTQSMGYSTLVGSTITASTMTTQSMGYSTLTGSMVTTSSVTASTIGVNTMSVSTMTASTIGTTILNVNGSSSSFTTGLLNIVNTNTAPQESAFILAPNMTQTTSANGIVIGQSASANNSFMIQYNHVTAGSTTNYLSIYPYSAGGGFLCLNAAGNVGIRTNAPNAPLQTVFDIALPPVSVSSIWPCNICITGPSSFHLKLGTYYTGGIGQYCAIQSTETYLSSGINEHTKNLILNPLGGNVGIGKTNPTAALDVTGSLFINNGAVATSPSAFQGMQMAYVGTGSTGYGYILCTNPGATWNSLCLNPTSGNVGIGITNPGYTLDIRGSLQLTGNGVSTILSDTIFFNVKADDSFNGNGGTTVYSNSINLRAGDLTWSGNRVYGAQIYIGGGYSVNGANNPGALIFSTNNTARMTILGNGTVNIGSTANVFGTLSINGGADQNPLWLVNGYLGRCILFADISQTIGNNAGSITCNTTTVFYNTSSDRRLKENIHDIINIRNMIDTLRPRTFNFIADKNKQSYIGFIAQEVKENFPQYVVGIENDNEFLCMDYSKMTPFAIAACKDLYNIVDKKITEISTLQATITQQQTQINQLIQRLATAGIV